MGLMGLRERTRSGSTVLVPWPQTIGRRFDEGDDEVPHELPDYNLSCWWLAV